MDIDSDVFWVFASKLALIGKGPVLVFLVIATLTTEVQGIWFTFISLSYLSTFADLGFTLLITQFVSHEFVNVSLINGFIHGKRENRDKFFTLIRYAIKLYIVVIPILLFLMVVIGFYVFKNSTLDIKIAWILFAFIGAINLFINLLQSIYQGMDKVTYIYRARSIGTMLFFIVAAIMLSFGFGIWSIVVSSSIAAIFLLLNLFKHSRYFWIQLYRYKPKIYYSWMNEIIKLQGKYAISWASGYAIFHLLVPITYATVGAITAGQIGATVTLIVGLSSKSGDLEINVMKGKQLTNMRTQGTDENVVLTPVRKMSIAEQLSMLNTDEALEITPKSLRLRKFMLNPHDRKRKAKAS